jgi:hypothetical protein
MDADVAGVVDRDDGGHDSHRPCVMFGALPVPFMSGVPGAPVVFDLSSALDPRIAFTRAPNGTAGYFDSTGLYKTAAINVPRFTYNPATLAADGLLIEQAFTQNMLNTDVIGGYSLTNATITSNAIVAPDGTTTTDKFILTNTTASINGRVQQNFASFTSTGTYTFYVIIKVADTAFNSARLSILDTTTVGNNVTAYFDASLGTVSSTAAFGTATNPSSGIQDIGAGYYLCWITGTFTTPGGLTARLLNYNNGSSSVIGDGISGIYTNWWQLVQGSMPFLYLAAAGSAGSKSADIATVSDISWLNRASGTIFIEAVPYGLNSSGNNQTLLALSDNTTSNYWQLRIDSAGTLRVSGVGGTPWNSVSLGTMAAYGVEKLAFGWTAAGSASVSRNGAAATTTAGPFAFPAAVSQMDIGNLAANFFMNGTVRSIKFWNYRKPDAELALLSA